MDTSHIVSGIKQSCDSHSGGKARQRPLQTTCRPSFWYGPNEKMPTSPLQQPSATIDPVIHGIDNALPRLPVLMDTSNRFEQTTILVPRQRTTTSEYYPYKHHHHHHSIIRQNINTQSKSTTRISNEYSITANQHHRSHHPRTRSFIKKPTNRTTRSRFFFISKKQILQLSMLSASICLLIALVGQNLSVSCLESPARIHQRNRLQQQNLTNSNNLLQSNHNKPSLSITNNSYSQDNQRFSNTRFRRTYNDPQTLNRHNPNKPSTKEQDQHCPSEKLMQSLLPPEYAGSPASSRSSSTARSKCSCARQVDGWEITCYHGSFLPQQMNNIGNMHPGYKNKPNQSRQQQRHQTGSRRSRRSSLNGWQDVSERSGGNTNEDASSHEGFGEDNISTGPTLTINTTINPQQRASPHLKYRNMHSNSTTLSQAIHGKNDELNNNQREMHRQDNFRDSIEGLEPSASQSISEEYQVTPILFIIRYIRNSKMELECGKTSPYYRAAMFLGK